MAIQYGIIGTGMMGVEHILNLKEIPGTIINAIADPYVPSQEAAKRAVGNENISVSSLSIFQFCRFIFACQFFLSCTS